MPERRLAAILAADVVGYSALMAEDEVGTLEALRRLRRELFHPAVAGHRGKVVKNMGDGWLVEFGSAVDAVNCALRVQTGLAADPKVRVRIGIHIGDIVHQDEDIFGDGVNVAARLEAIAEPGAVVISDAVYGTLDGTVAYQFDDAGEKRLKNIARPVSIWMHRDDTARAHREVAAAPPGSHQVGGTRLAIHPVTTADQREEIRALAAALTNDLLGYLNSSTWLGAQIRETVPPGVAALNATLRTDGDRLRIDATLTDRDGAHLWTRRIDGGVADGLDWQDSTGGDIASGVQRAMMDAAKAELAAIPPDDMDAETCVLAAKLTTSGHVDDILAALGFIDRVIAKAPDWDQPYAYGAFLISIYSMAGYGDRLGRYQELLDDWIVHADALIDSGSPYRLALAFARHRRTPDARALRATMKSVLRRHPYNEDALALGWASAFTLGKPLEAYEYARRSASINADIVQAAAPHVAMSFACVMLGRDQEAIEHALTVLDLRPDFLAGNLAHAAACGHLGRTTNAAKAVEELRRLMPGCTIRDARESRRFAVTDETERFYEGLRLAGLPEGET